MEPTAVTSLRSTKTPSNKHTNGGKAEISAQISALRRKSTMKSLGLPTVSELRVKGAVVHYLKGVEGDMRRLGSRYREDLRLQIAKVYALACILRDDRDQWLEFCLHPFWGKRGPRDNDRRASLKYALKMACGAGRAAQQRASKYWNALRGWFAKKVLANQIPARVKNTGGWQKCAAIHAALRKSKLGAGDSSTNASPENQPKSKTNSSSSHTAQDNRLPVVNVEFRTVHIKKLAKTKPNGRIKIVADVITVDKTRITARARKVIL
jgi:hypothetical protein